MKRSDRNAHPIIPVVLMAFMLSALTAVAEAQEQQHYDQAHQVPQGPGMAPGAPPAIFRVSQDQPMARGQVPNQFNPATLIPGEGAAIPVRTNLGGDIGTLGPYTLGPDDIIFIVVRGQPEFSGSYVIGQDGRVQYGIVGDINANGMTRQEFATVITEELKQYVRFPDVFVTITGFNSQAIYILGRVAAPGKYAMRGDSIKIRDALIAAGLELDYAALRRVKVIKTDPENPHTEKYNLKRVMYKGETKDNIDLVSGDVVVVPTSVWGHVVLFLRAVISPVVRVGRWVI